MRVSVSSVLEHKDPDQVDEQTSDRDRKQPVVVNVRRFQSSLQRDRYTCRDGFRHGDRSIQGEGFRQGDRWQVGTFSQLYQSVCVCVTSTPSEKMKKAVKMRKSPLTKPARTSALT